MTRSVTASPIFGAAPASVDTARSPLQHDRQYNWVQQYIQTEASDRGVAAAQGVNYVPALANVLTSNPGAVDDIYLVTNFTQGNVFPSAPTPAGPGNTSPSYSPLWQVTTVTWANPKKAVTLHSEAEVFAAEAAKLVTLSKTTIIVNCPMIYSTQGESSPPRRSSTDHSLHWQ